MAAAMLVVTLGAATPASARSVRWVDQFGSRSSESGTWGLDVLGSDIFTGGRTYGSLPGQSSHGDADAWIRRTSPNGSAVWTVQFGTAAFDNVEDLDASRSGIYVIGATRGAVASSPAGGTDAYLARFDRNGHRLWATQFGGRKDDWAISVVKTRSGIYVYGQTFGPFPGYRYRGRGDLFLALFDLDGSLRWMHQFGSRGHEEPWAMELADDGLYIDGYTNGRLGGARRGSWDAYVASVSFDGRVLWLRQFGSSEADYGSGLLAGNQSVYVSGQTFGTLHHARNRGRSDAFVRKFSPRGSTVWTRQFGTKRGDAAGAVIRVQHEIVAVGRTGGAFPGETNLGAGDVFARAFGATAGEPQWSFQFGSSAWDSVGWAWGGANRAYVIGDSAGSFPGEDSRGGIDSYLARIDTT